MPWTVMPDFETHEQACDEFEWNLPEQFNPAVDFLRKHEASTTAETHSADTGTGTGTGAEAGDGDGSVNVSGMDRIALQQAYPDGRRKSYTYRELDQQSDRLAQGLADIGIEAGDRVGVVVSQKPQNPITHLANWKLGAISVPLTVLFGGDALQYRLADAGANAVVIDPAVREELTAIRDDCPALEHVIEIETETETDSNDLADRHRAFTDVLADPEETAIDPYESTPETETAIMYTSGSTGPPKGVLHSHALWLGRAAAAYNYFDQGLGPNATVWTPADWAWGAALGGTLFATWHHGGTIVGYPAEGFDANEAVSILEEFGVTQSFMPPTALRMLMDVDDPTEQYTLDIETFAAAGEPLTPEIVQWVEETFSDVTINEFYGQTELNLAVGNSSSWFETRPGSMGKPLPGYELAILDPDAASDGDIERCPAGEPGEIALRPHDRSVFFDEYWHMPEQTAAKQIGEWFLTGDLAARDEDGYVWFKSRKDDVIITAGYRVGPMEVEEAILAHPDVTQAGVIGVPAETRGEIIKAFLEVRDDVNPSDTLREEVRDLVRENLAAYEYPRAIEFVDELPQTTTGKIRRLELRKRENQ